MYETLLQWDQAWDPSDEHSIYSYPACQKDHRFHFFLKQVKTWYSTSSVTTLMHQCIKKRKEKDKEKKDEQTDKQAHHFEIVWLLWKQGAQPQQYFHTWLNLYRGSWTELKNQPVISCGHWKQDISQLSSSYFNFNKLKDIYLQKIRRYCFNVLYFQCTAANCISFIVILQ